ncbi:MAG: copper resistance CopC/CopD family protein [Actinomycetota bacterium]
MTARARLRAATVVVVATVAVTTGAAAASAHADLVSSSPANGAVLATAPSRIALTFTEAADPTLSTVAVLGSGGTALQTGPVTAQAPEILTVSMPPQVADGAYTVAWRAVSADDGHVTAGAFSFSVGTSVPPSAAPAQTETASGPSLLSIVAKVLLYVGLMLFVSVAAVWFAVFREPATRARPVVVTAATAALAGAILLVLDERRSVGVPLGELLRSSTGHTLVWLLAAVVITDVLAVAWLLRPARVGLLVASALGAAVAMVVHVMGGHASASPTPWLQEALQSIHFLAAGLWVGGLVFLVVLLRRPPTAPVTQAERFSSLALGAVVVIVVTGLVRAVDQLGGLGEVVHGATSAYGITLLVKIGLVLLLIAAGAWNRRRTVPRLAEDPRGLRRVVTGEVVVAAGIVVLTATLTGLNPPKAATAPSNVPPASIIASGSDFGTTMKVTLSATPGVPGSNRFVVQAQDYDTGAPLAADAVTLTFTSVTRPNVPSSVLFLARQGDAWAANGPQLSLAGTWTVEIEVRTGGTATDARTTLVTRDAATTSATSPSTADIPAVTTTKFPDGAELQTFVDPGSAGTNQVHVTAFAADGTELDVKDPAIVAIPPSGEPQLLDLLKAGTGHFVGNVVTTPGPWRFDVVCTEVSTGSTLQATMQRTIAGGSG